MFPLKSEFSSQSTRLKYAQRSITFPYGIYLRRFLIDFRDCKHCWKGTRGIAGITANHDTRRHTFLNLPKQGSNVHRSAGNGARNDLPARTMLKQRRQRNSAKLKPVHRPSKHLARTRNTRVSIYLRSIISPTPLEASVSRLANQGSRLKYRSSALIRRWWPAYATLRNTALHSGSTRLNYEWRSITRGRTRVPAMRVSPGLRGPRENVYEKGTTIDAGVAPVPTLPVIPAIYPPGFNPAPQSTPTSRCRIQMHT